MTPQPYSQLIHCKRWADHGLYQAIEANCAALDADEQVIMARILDHIHVVDRIFRCHLLGKPHTFTAARSDVLPSIAETIEIGRFVDDWYVDYVDSMAQAAFADRVGFTFTSGKPAQMTRGEILLHVAMHGSYHRGNVGILLQKKGLAPGPDAITDYLEAGSLRRAT